MGLSQAEMRVNKRQDYTAKKGLVAIGGSIQLNDLSYFAECSFPVQQVVGTRTLNIATICIQSIHTCHLIRP